uniref:Protein kinase domain-containing protein n=1 Tax=Angiostrongylus cantonensis TaxID=6313 RepID=A0A0K0DCP7_ANGCA
MLRVEGLDNSDIIWKKPLICYDVVYCGMVLFTERLLHPPVKVELLELRAPVSGLYRHGKFGQLLTYQKDV